MSIPEKMVDELAYELGWSQSESAKITLRESLDAIGVGKLIDAAKPFTFANPNFNDILRIRDVLEKLGVDMS